jgi:uncharacterized membrane protein YagU involved in acid resistance
MRHRFITLAAKLLFPFSPGTIAGLFATIPMTLSMLLLQRVLPQQQRYALPPERITNELARRVGVKKHLDKRQRLGAALVSHFGYGAIMGALYTLFARRIPLPSLLKGAVFGLVVWAGSYLGLLPALRLSQSAPREPSERNLMMIAVHLIWGAVTGVVAESLMRLEMQENKSTAKSGHKG